MTLLPIPIPQGYTILVKVGEKVSAGDPIAKGTPQDSPQDLVIEVAKDLQTDPKSAFKSLTKKPGDGVSAGDIIAKKGGVLGSREIRTKVSGTITNFDNETGQLSIRALGDVIEDSSSLPGRTINSPVDGEVSVCDNDKVVLKTDKEAILALSSSGQNSFGEIIFFEGKELDPSSIDNAVLGKIIIGETLDREVVSKAIGLGAVGIVGREIDESILENLRSKNINTPVLSVDEENFKKIGKKSGKLMLDSEKKLIIRL